MKNDESILPELLTSRPEGMSLEEYKAKLKDQKAMVEYYKKHGRKATVRRLRNIK